MRKALCAAMLFLVFSSSISIVSYADVPQLISYKGTLTDTGGSPMPDGDYDAVFSIYTTATGGTSLWSETWNTGSGAVPVSGGEFNVMLGSHTPIPDSVFADNPATYLGVKFGPDSEMTPRQRIASVGYTFAAGNGVPKGGIIMWSGSTSAVPSGWALCNGTNGTPDLRDRFIVGAGGGYSVGATGGTSGNNISHTHTISAESPGTNTSGDHQHLLPIGALGNHWVLYELSGTGWAPAYGSITQYAGGTFINGSTASGEDMTLAYSQTSGNHAHTVNSHSHGSSTVTGGSTSLENRPPYYALAYIMKL